MLQEIVEWNKANVNFFLAENPEALVHDFS
jgi:hypothetical protein